MRTWKKGSHLATDFVYRDLCVDASEEDGRLGRLVNHGSKKEINCKMKLIGEVLCLFGTRDIHEGEELAII